MNNDIIKKIAKVALPVASLAITIVTNIFEQKEADAKLDEKIQEAIIKNQINEEA